MRCVVTGAAGFVGSNLVEALLSCGHEVRGIDCFVDYYPRAIKLENLRPAYADKRFKFIEADLQSADLVSLFDGVEWIFHLAAQAGVRSSWGEDFRIYLGNNIHATQRLLEACTQPSLRKSLRKLVYASSSSVYGSAETLPTSETVLPQPVSPYGVSKLAAEQLMVLYAREFDVPTVSLRYFTVYGPRQRPDMAFHRFIKAALAGQTLRVFGDGEQSRDFTFIEDIVRATMNAAEAKESGIVFNVGGGSRLTVNQVLKKLEKIVGRGPLEVEYLKREAGDAKHTSADISQAERYIGYRPKVTLDEGLAKQVSWLAESSKLAS